MILPHSDTFFPILNLAVGFLIFSMLVMSVFVFTFSLRWNLFIALLTDFTTQLSFSMPGGLPSLGSHRVGHDWSDLAAAACFLMFRKISLYFVGTKDLFFSWNCKPENNLQQIFLFFFFFAFSCLEITMTYLIPLLVTWIKDAIHKTHSNAVISVLPFSLE